jgi:MFS transporter, PAT family, beta-lactamase induction signal transducer AmpG
MNAERHAPPWLFGITAIPYGIVGGFCGTTMPFLTRKAGISVESIGWFGLATMIPPMLQFLYAPIIDVGPKRKHWLVIVTLLGAACLCTAMMMPLPSAVGPFLAFTVAGQLISGLVGSCNGGLLASTMPNELRGAAGGWLNAGNLGGGALGSWVAIVMTNRGAQPIVLGLTVAAMMVVPSLAALFIVEAERVKRSARQIIGTTLRDVWSVARSKPGWTGMLFCMSPVGTAALINYFSGLAVDYKASDGMVAFVNGPVNGLLTAAGSLAGGYLCDRMNRRVAYLASGALTAVCALAMSFAPLSPSTYAIGVSTYLFIAGLCYAAFSAVVLEAIGRAGAAASTQYTLFTAAGNAAIGYVGFVDTRFHTHYGVKSLLRVDAGLNLLGIVVLSLMIAFVYKGTRAQRSEPAAA